MARGDGFGVKKTAGVVSIILACGAVAAFLMGNNTAGFVLLAAATAPVVPMLRRKPKAESSSE